MRPARYFFVIQLSNSRIEAERENKRVSSREFLGGDDELDGDALR